MEIIYSVLGTLFTLTLVKKSIDKLVKATDTKKDDSFMKKYVNPPFKVIQFVLDMAGHPNSTPMPPKPKRKRKKKATPKPVPRAGQVKTDLGPVKPNPNPGYMDNDF